MSGLKSFLESADVGVTSTGHELHIANSFLEAAVGVIEAGHFIAPTWSATGAAAVGGATVAGVTLAFVGPVLGLTGVFMALGSGYQEAREAIQNEAVASGFSQGFVAGILNMSAKTVSFIFGRHGVIRRNQADPEADVIEAKAYNRGLVAGYTHANLASAEQKKSFVFELRPFTNVSAGAWGDREKRDYVIEYAVQLRLHFLNT